MLQDRDGNDANMTPYGSVDGDDHNDYNDHEQDGSLSYPSEVTTCNGPSKNRNSLHAWCIYNCNRSGRCKIFFTTLALFLLAMTGAFITLKMTESPESTPTTAKNESDGNSDLETTDGKDRNETIRNNLLEMTEESVLVDTNSTQNRAFEWIVGKDNLGFVPSDPLLIQRYVLAIFYFSTEGDTWNQSQGWLSDNDECQWFGVECGTSESNLGRISEGEDVFNYDVFADTALSDAEDFFTSRLGAVININLPDNNLKGSIPQELGYVKSIEHLTLNANKLNGIIPPSIGNLSNLVAVNLDDNDLSGEVPQSLCDLQLGQLTLPNLECSCCDGLSKGGDPIPDCSVTAGLDDQVGKIEGKGDNDPVGYGVSASGNGKRIAVGSHTNKNGTKSARVQVYEGCKSWEPIGTVMEIEIEGGSEPVHPLSTSLSVDGTRLAIGVASATDNKGVVRVYEYRDSKWEKVGSDLQAGESFGYSVSLSQDGYRVAVGEPKSDNENGRVFVYEYISGDWTLFGDRISGEGNAGQFGWSVSLEASGNMVAAGAPASSTVKVYEYKNGWKKKGKDIVGEEQNDRFGHSVSTSKNAAYIAAGAPESNGNGIKLGRASVHKFDQNDWSLQGNIIHGDLDNGNTGFSVSLSSDAAILIVGTPGNDMPNESSGGHAKIYRNNDEHWSQLVSNLVVAEPGDSPGYSVFVSSQGNRGVIGVPPRDMRLGRGYVETLHINQNAIETDVPTVDPTMKSSSSPSTSSTPPPTMLPSTELTIEPSTKRSASPSTSLTPPPTMPPSSELTIEPSTKSSASPSTSSTPPPTMVPSAKSKSSLPTESLVPSPSLNSTLLSNMTSAPSLSPNFSSIPDQSNATIQPQNITQVPLKNPSTLIPTVSSIPTTSVKPTQIPTISLMPTASNRPTQNPTVSSMPTVTRSPTKLPSVLSNSSLPSNLTPSVPEQSNITTHPQNTSQVPSETPSTLSPTMSLMPTASNRPTQTPTESLMPTVTRSPTKLPSVLSNSSLPSNLTSSLLEQSNITAHPQNTSQVPSENPSTLSPTMSLMPTTSNRPTQTHAASSTPTVTQPPTKLSSVLSN